MTARSCTDIEVGQVKPDQLFNRPHSGAYCSKRSVVDVQLEIFTLCDAATEHAGKLTSSA